MSTSPKMRFPYKHPALAPDPVPAPDPENICETTTIGPVRPDITERLRLIPIPLYTGIIIRLALIILYPTIMTCLVDRVEVSTPLTSNKRLKEGLFLWMSGIPVYEGGLYHQVIIQCHWHVLLLAIGFIKQFK